nr:helix-turn-helix transcriptional regulator [Diplocloster modestus]
MAALCLFPLLGIIAAKQYPSRFISPWIIGLCLIGLLIHSALLEAFRDTPATLYIVYLVISVSVVILYLILEPYLIYSFRKGTSLAVLLSPAEDVPAVRSTAVQVWEPQPDTSCTAEAEAPAPPRETAVSVFDILSGQELRVVELMQRGFSNREMAEVMKISENTVKGYRSTMYSKLQIHSKRELFALVEKEK